MDGHRPHFSPSRRYYINQAVVRQQRITRPMLSSPATCLCLLGLDVCRGAGAQTFPVKEEAKPARPAVSTQCPPVRELGHCIGGLIVRVPTPTQGLKPTHCETRPPCPRRELVRVWRRYLRFIIVVIFGHPLRTYREGCTHSLACDRSITLSNREVVNLEPCLA
jgi:hypothetical protein